MKIYNININIKDHPGLIKSEHIEFSELGKFVGTSNSWWKINIDDVINNPVKFTKPTLVQIKDCTIYRFPKLSLPRNKMDLLKENANIKVTRNMNSADYKVISNNYLSKLLNANYRNFISGVDLFDALRKIETSFTSDAWIKLTSAYNKFKQEGNEEVLFNMTHNKYWKCSNPSIDNLGKVLDKLSIHTDSYQVYVETKNLKTFDTVTQSNNLVLDTHMNNLCSSNLHTLTQEETDNMMKILSTNDRENLALALEMMSNCNIEKSLDYVSFLFYFNYSNLKNASNWNSINVKTLRKSLKEYEAYDSHLAYFYERYLKQLAKDNYLTQWAFKATAKRMLEGGLHSWGINKDFFKIDLDDIKINDKYKDKLIPSQTGAQILSDITSDPFDDLPF